MNKTEIQEYEGDFLDNCEEPGFGIIYTEPKDTVYTRIRELIEYARLKGVEPSDLSREEIAMFEYSNQVQKPKSN